MSTPVIPSTVPGRFERIKIRLLGKAGGCLLGVLSRTLRWQYVGAAADLSFWRKGSSARIVAFWHDQQLVMPWVYRRPGLDTEVSMWVLRSQHRDGQLIAEVLSHCGVSTVGGSSSRGGTRALLALHDKLKEGCAVGITPDGPRGPRHKAKPGALKLAQLSGMPIYPMALCSEKRWTLGSWDRMTIPKPFSKIVLAIGEPITVPRRCSPAEFDQQLQRLEQAIDDLTTLVEKQATGAALPKEVADAGAH